MPTDGEGNYDVGYRKPPQDSRFKKGQSGNPKGRPKESKNWDTLIDKELSARVVVHKDGRRKKISKREAIATQLVNKAVSGDLRFARELLDRPASDKGTGRSISHRAGWKTNHSKGGHPAGRGLRLRFALGISWGRTRPSPRGPGRNRDARTSELAVA